MTGEKGGGGPALVAAAALATHATALMGGMVWLDHAHLEDRLALAVPGRWSELFGGGFAGTGFYRPLMSLSLSVDDALGGAALIYHATTLISHAAAAVMTVVAAGALGLSRRTALLAGLLFAVHPATSVVASAIAFRSESMIAVALLALIVFHIERRPLAAALAVVAGALTKETALLLAPLLIAGLEVGGWPNVAAAGSERPSVRHLARPRGAVLAAEGAGLMAAVILRVAFAPPWRATFPPMLASEALGTRLAALWRSATLMIGPVDRTICDAFPVQAIVTLPALAGLAVAAAIVYLACKQRGPALLMALALLPSLNLVPVMRWWSPHYLYVPLAFGSMVAAQALGDRTVRLWPVAACGLLLLAVVTARDDLRFRDDATLWAPEVAANDSCREGHVYLGEGARQAGRLEDAAVHYERAAAPTTGVLSYVDRGAALQNLGVVRLQQGRAPEAAAAFRAALALTGAPHRRQQLEYNLRVSERRASTKTGPSTTHDLTQPGQ